MDLVVLTTTLALLAIVWWFSLARFRNSRRVPPHSSPLSRSRIAMAAPGNPLLAHMVPEWNRWGSGEQRRRPESSLIPDIPHEPGCKDGARPLARAFMESERLCEALFEEGVAGILMTSVSGRILDCNLAACRMLGMPTVEEARGLDAREFYPTDRSREHLLTLVRERGKLELHEIDMIRTDGERIHTLANVQALYDARGKLAKIVSHFVDVTEQKVLRKQLRNAQRMEAVGRLAGGIAHDFNNLLTTISGHADLLLMDPAADDSVRSDVARIKRAADRAGTLVQQLLAFSRQQVLKARVMDLNQTMNGVVDMVDRLIGEDIEVVTVPGRSLWNVWADPGLMDQVLLNLVVNARDAMPGGGTLTLASRNVDLKGSLAASRDLETGQYAVLEVTDTGIGIPEADQLRIFEPFFTTKDSGKGTGLGLAMAYGIVKQSGGHIEVESTVGRGTSFRIFLPRVTGESHAVGPAEGGLTAPTGTETILLVEDEQMVRSLARRVLQRQGYAVLEAAHGSAALEAAQECTGPIHLLLTDLVLPDMDGRALATHLRDTRPEMAFLYVSGYAKESNLPEGFSGPEGSFLAKPFGPVELAQQVRNAIDEHASERRGRGREGGLSFPT